MFYTQNTIEKQAPISTPRQTSMCRRRLFYVVALVFYVLCVCCHACCVMCVLLFVIVVVVVLLWLFVLFCACYAFGEFVVSFVDAGCCFAFVCFVCVSTKKQAPTSTPRQISMRRYRLSFAVCVAVCVICLAVLLFCFLLL